MSENLFKQKDTIARIFLLVVQLNIKNRLSKLFAGAEYVDGLKGRYTNGGIGMSARKKCLSPASRSKEKQKTARGTVLEFCHCWFEERNVQNALVFLADDVGFVGTGEGELAFGKAALGRYISRDVEELQESFSCKFTTVAEHEVTEHVCNIFGNVVLENTLYTWSLFASLNLRRQEDGLWYICGIHVAEPSPNQQKEEHYPNALMAKSIAHKRQELLNNSVSGGMMGGYMEAGFPFYFINRRMLDYLGYADEADFVNDNDGYISNCMHPDDRGMVDREVEEQLQEKDEYVVEYRMRKKDGSYIWVHDLGLVMTAEDGRAAISSVCIDITPQYQAREEVSHIYNNIPGAVFRCRFDVDFSVISANDGLFEFLGYSREEFAAMGSKMSSVIHPEDLEIMEGKLVEQLRQGSTFNNENRLICKDGTQKWISIKGQLFEEEGEAYFYCVFVDITEEKHLQEQIRGMYEQELAYFSEVASGGGSIQGSINLTQNRVENYIASENKRVAQAGDSFDETIQKLAASALKKEDGNYICSVMTRRQVLSDYSAGKLEHQFEFLRRRKDGELFWSDTRFRTCLNPETGDVFLFFYTKDITEQKLRDNKLTRIAELDYDTIVTVEIRRDRFRRLSSDDGEKNFLPLQGSFQQEIRLFAERCMDGINAAQYLKYLDYSYIKEQLKQNETYTFVTELRDNTGEIRVKRYRVFYTSKELERVCITRTDVSDIVHQEQKQKEELSAALAAANQASVAKSNFLSRMSHEIRTPMNAIIGMTAVAAQSVGDADRIADCISKIGISSRFLLSLINDILDMSRIESGKMLLQSEQFSIVQFLEGINSICHSQAENKDVEYECIVDPVLDEYYIGDAMKLQQVLLNILGNAVKFTGEGGRICFRVEQRTWTKDSSQLRFIIRDTGIGIDSKFIPHMFEPFAQESTSTTTLFGGTGLGVAIAKNIVDLMDGKIQVHSIKGVGTEFIVDVPLGTGVEARLPHGNKLELTYFSNWRTLVVDDDVTVCESTALVLRDMGIQAEWVDSGTKAVERVRSIQEAGGHYDLVLIDWKMPEMDGIETARQIRTVVSGESIIIMTAYDWLSIEQAARQVGVDFTMSKPVFKTTLLNAFTKVLEQNREEHLEEKVYDFTNHRLLLVEDNAINTEIAVMLLENRGFIVDIAENGLQALELFGKSEPGYYSAILMDIRMPIMDGLMAATSIRNLSNADAETIPIIAMTANAFEDDREKSRLAGMNAHLAKPIDAEILYKTLYDFVFKK